MDFPIFINWMSSLPILWLLSGIFHFCSNFQKKQQLLFANSEEPDQTPCFAASDLVLHCLPLSHKKDARLIWVNDIYTSSSLYFERGMPLVYNNNK